MTLTVARTVPSRRRIRKTGAAVAAAVIVVAGVLGAGEYHHSRHAGPAPGLVQSQGTSDVSYVTTVGQPLDVSVAIVNAGDSAVTFESASLVAVDGYRPGVLMHVGVYEDPDPPVLSIGWAPLKPAVSGGAAFTGSRLRVTDLKGYRLTPGRTVTLVYAMKGDGKSGTFVAGGVNLTYQSPGGQRASTVWGAGIDCAGGKVGTVCAPKLGDKLLDAIDKLKG